MQSNLTTSYMALQAERARLDDTAARGWLADEAATSRTRRPLLTLSRQHAGVILVTLGERLQGAPISAAPTAKTARS